ncbi:MAG: flavodoxin family protein [Candidatus Altiarchaeota archaeon]
MKKKVLGVSGSHRHANTDELVKRALEYCGKKGLETEFIPLADLEVGYCTDCGVCRTGFECSIDDDVFPVLEKMSKADGMIVGSPVYFSSVSGKLKALFDRTLPLRRNGMMLSGKVGGAVAVGGSRNGGQEFTVRDIQNWMLLQEMTVVGDVKTAHFGGIVHGRNPGDWEKDGIGLETVDNLAENIVRSLKRS